MLPAQVFVDDAYLPAQSYSTLGIFHINLLYGKSIIDQCWDTRRALALAAAQQFFGHYTTQWGWYVVSSLASTQHNGGGMLRVEH